MAATYPSHPFSIGICLVAICTLIQGIEQTSFLSSYNIIIPQKVARARRDTAGSSGENSLSYAIEVEGKKHVLHLEKNRDFIASDFAVYTYAANGSIVSSQLQDKEHCHYQGYAEGVPGSVAAISTCSGLRGMLHLQNSSYGIEPLDSSDKFQHLIYRLEDVKSEPMVCGVTAADKEPETDINPLSMTQLLRRKRAVLHQTRYVELFLVVDKERFDMLGRNETAVRAEMVQLSNYLDSMYTMLNIRIVLVGLMIWTDGNKIGIDGTAGDVLGRFVQWRETSLVSLRRHDSAQLVLKKGFGGTAGMAFVGTVCSRSHAGGINVFSHYNVQSFASIVAHELGHNLGMNHDDGRNCLCSVDTCIMNSGATGSKNFSSCSEEDFEKLTLSKGGTCLLNMPKPDEAYSAPFCGNKLVDIGEECDCGSPKECEKDPCCEPGTCKLRSGAQCAYGTCCQNCRFSSGGTVCRAVANECDLPEYCNGSSPFCQPDVYIQNGHPCQNSKAYCYNGMCQYYDAQCQAIFGSKAKSAPPVCYQEVNSKGDRFGNCGFQGSDYRKCDTRNARCGKLQCENVETMPVFGIRPSYIQTPIHGTTTICWGVDFQLGSDVPDPAMVNEGTKCDEGKICSKFQCVDASVLQYDCDVQKKCGGNGVCNTNKNCHCNEGWAFPNCQTKGYGGSIDSGPTYNDKDTSLRDGLLVFFFLIVPLLALGAFVFFRRNELKRRFCRKKRSQAHEVDNKNQTGGERQASGPPRNTAAPGRGVPNPGPPRNAHNVPPNRGTQPTGPPRNMPNPAQNQGPSGPPRNVPPAGPYRSTPATSPPHSTPYQPNNFAVPTYTVKQPQHTPSRPPLPHQREAAANITPSRPAPAPPL
ncbi:disintegrin and metalloproteinase domain-containing protein 9 precursor [Xenopus tropicalis]|uniref:Disintegrin and metalloproteinase domain-containing protein 9 precursor n=1 Tax=Xenopus tropicalis TaxID=8364 RepID=E2ICL5_XENTR|nr:disintegrin and metalloproteinase domain-containing protein 9 precursor [Xenopus tropicalis]ADK56763.1 metalloproteinase ADAM9 [Xenopus tropicalis]|eukprot:NP_001233130.1 disintegrin and metalloproteinase domain-containing protein 9 precursor [Xenopus tropicalis]